MSRSDSTIFIFDIYILHLLKDMIIKILLSGDGGQGIQLISDLLAQAAFGNGLFVSQVPNYGLEQRGGVSLSFLIISDKEITYPRFTKPDILLVMSEQARERVKNYESRIKNYDIRDYGEFLAEQGIERKSYNVFFLGLVAKILEEKKILEREKVFELLEKKLSGKANWQENKRTWDLAFKNSKF